jgi:hypothetical protein
MARDGLISVEQACNAQACRHVYVSFAAIHLSVVSLLAQLVADDIREDVCDDPRK